MTIYLLEENKEKELSNWLKQSIFHYIDIKLDKGLLSIENRQHYCDRGRFSVKAFSNCVKTFYIDHQDMFPRYYFILDNLLCEMQCWLQFRNINVISIEKKVVNFGDNDESKNV